LSSEHDNGLCRPSGAVVTVLNRKRGGVRLALAIASVLLSGVGCDRSPQLLRAPIHIGPSVTAVRLEPPLHVLGPEFELRFEFDRPGDSHHAGRIQVALVTSDGSRDTLRDVRLDRRGEGTVSQIGRLELDRAASARSRIYGVMELWSDVPLRLRGVRGSSSRGGRES
jgi:hypothetical protein